ncbi:thiamine diphosphokinase [Paenibacillus thailandensis]|uniref:Thiamine diphosphokinase n=1 Tax=Paenibacillus thailandensis TaxID=393250 RepID=A0ABW5QU74_9BACL
MYKQVVICTGGSLGDWALPHLQHCDFLIGADKGAYFLASQGFRMNAALGDFDSVEEEQLALVRASSDTVSPCDPVDKDYTDTELAFRLALGMKPRHIKLLGATGTRFDHTLANVHLLSTALDEGVEASIIDEHNRISITGRSMSVEKSEFTHVSLLPLTERVTGITLTGFRYPLCDATLRIGQSLGISNVLDGDSGLIELREGRLLVIESRD